jgi:hypothetical protein
MRKNAALKLIHGLEISKTVIVVCAAMLLNTKKAKLRSEPINTASNPVGKVMEISVDHEAVNKMLADAILKSAIGEAVEKAIKNQISSLTTSYNNPIESVIASHVHQIAREILVEQHGQLIRERIAAALSAKLTDDFISRVCDKAADRYS